MEVSAQQDEHGGRRTGRRKGQEEAAGGRDG